MRLSLIIRISALVLPGMLFVACASANRPVTYTELAAEPFLEISSGGRVLVVFSNSTQNSALSISSIEIDIDETERQVFIQARQSPVSNPRPVFDLGMPAGQGLDYEYYFVDPDGTKHLLGFG